MRYIIHKCCKLNSNPNNIFDLERPDVCKDETEVVETFKDAFKHHIGRKPNENQIDIFKKFENVFVEEGEITYIFYMIISD